MDSFSKTPTSILFSLLFLFGFFVVTSSAIDINSFVYKGCANQNNQNPSEIFTQNLKTMYSTLVPQSSAKYFSSLTTGDGSNGVIGVFQCRGDLTSTQCYSCVSKIPKMANKLCGNSIAARIQLNGCYLRYEISGFNKVSGTQLLYKICGSIQSSDDGFEGKRRTALEMVVNGVKNGGLFYTGSYQYVYVFGQCEGDLSNGDCGDCLKVAMDSVKSQCSDSTSGQIYLHKCYVSYNYYPNGVPSISSGTGSRTNHPTQKTVAIAVGGVAAFGFAVVCLLFLMSVLKNRRRGKNGDY